MDSNRQRLRSEACRCALVTGAWVLALTPAIKNDPGTLGWRSYPQAITNSTNLSSGKAAANAGGNIDLNQAAGTGNLPSNSLTMGIANPSWTVRSRKNAPS